MKRFVLTIVILISSLSVACATVQVFDYVDIEGNIWTRIQISLSEEEAKRQGIELEQFYDYNVRVAQAMHMREINNPDSEARFVFVAQSIFPQQNRLRASQYQGTTRNLFVERLRFVVDNPLHEFWESMHGNSSNNSLAHIVRYGFDDEIEGRRVTILPLQQEFEDIDMGTMGSIKAAFFLNRNLTMYSYNARRVFVEGRAFVVWESKLADSGQLEIVVSRANNVGYNLVAILVGLLVVGIIVGVTRKKRGLVRERR